MRAIKGYLRKYVRDIVVGQSFKLVEAVLELLLPLIMASLIDLGVGQGVRSALWTRGLMMAGITVVGLMTTLVCQVVASRASQNFGTELRRGLFAHIQSLSSADVDRVGAPSMITRLTNDVNQLQFALAMLIRLVVRAPFLAVGSIVMALILNLRLSLVFLVTTPLITLTLYWVMRRSIPFFQTLQRKLDGIGRITRENLLGVRVVRAFSRQDHESARFAKATGEYTDMAVRVGQLSALLNPATTVIMNLGILAILWIGGHQVDGGFITQGMLIAFINYMIQIALQISIVARLGVTFTKASASLARVEEVFALTPSVPDTATSLPDIDPNAPAIELRRVSFTYPGGAAPALEDITVKALRGQTIGIIGGTGAGKSTLVNLIVRFYDATQGEIQVLGAPLRAYPLEALRSRIGLVPQHAALVSGSIRNNLRWGNLDATDEAMWDSLDLAQATEFVERLTGRLDFLVEEGGKNLSGGQRQRLTIARAWVRKPQLLILDDSASSLDYATDAALRKALARHAEDTTVLIVSQRASAIRHADVIWVLDDGRLAGAGSHEALLERCEVYREICLSQWSEKEAAQ